MRDSKDYVLVPNSSQETPYRIDDVDNDHYIRIRQTGPDIVVLVPPGSDASDHRHFLETSMRATARSAVADRSSDLILKVLLFIAIPLLLIAGNMVLWSELVTPANDPMGFHSALRAAAPILTVAYLLVLLMPNVGISSSLFNTRYPARAEYLLRQMRDDAGTRYLTEKLFSGDQSLVTLRRVILDHPGDVPEGIWSTLWILAGGGELYPAAMDRLRRQARDFEDEILDSLREPFEAEYRVTLDDFESSRRSEDDDESEADPIAEETSPENAPEGKPVSDD